MNNDRDRLFHYVRGGGGVEPPPEQVRAAEALYQAGLACHNTERAWVRSLDALRVAVTAAHEAGIPAKDVIPLATQRGAGNMGQWSREKLRVMLNRIYKYKSSKEIRGEK